MASKIYIATWDTESGDHGVAGPWIKKPLQQDLEEFFRKEMPYEFEEEDSYIFWHLYEFDLENEPIYHTTDGSVRL